MSDRSWPAKHRCFIGDFPQSLMQYMPIPWYQIFVNGNGKLLPTDIFYSVSLDYLTTRPRREVSREILNQELNLKLNISQLPRLWKKLIDDDIFNPRSEIFYSYPVQSVENFISQTRPLQPPFSAESYSDQVISYKLRCFLPYFRSRFPTSWSTPAHFTHGLEPFLPNRPKILRRRPGSSHFLKKEKDSFHRPFILDDIIRPSTSFFFQWFKIRNQT